MILCGDCLAYERIHMRKKISDINQKQLQALQEKMNCPINEVGIDDLEKYAREAGLSVRDYIAVALKEYDDNTS